MTQKTIPPIEIFRTGDFMSLEGVKVSFAAADLQAIADAYEPSTDPAPIVVGHPSIDAPAYGWTDHLSVVGDRLVAMPKDIEPSFAEMVNAGRFRRVSAQFYDPDSPDNPKPGRHYLKHIGFLGAHPPSVKGLKTVAFGEPAAGASVTIEHDFPTTQETIVDPDEKKKQELSFAERETALADREAKLAEREKAAKDAATKARHAANVSFAEAQIGAGKLAPAGKDLLVAVLDDLDDSKTVSFGEKGGELTPAAAMRKLFDGAQPVVSFGELAKREKRDPVQGDDADPTAIALKAGEYIAGEKAKGRSVSFAEAVRHVRRPDPDG